MTDALEIIFILDASGSMGENDGTRKTITCFNEFLAQQQALVDCKPVKLTLVSFNNTSRTIYKSMDISSVPPLTEKDYVPEGTTRLYDTVMSVINLMVADVRDGLLVILTDGLDHHSTEFQASDVLVKTKELREQKGWATLYLASGLPEMDVAKKMGMEGRTYTDSADAFQTLSQRICEYRKTPQ